MTNVEALLRSKVGAGKAMELLHPEGAAIAGELVDRATTLLDKHFTSTRDRLRNLNSVGPMADGLDEKALKDARASRKAAAGLLRAAAILLEEA